MKKPLFENGQEKQQRSKVAAPLLLCRTQVSLNLANKKVKHMYMNNIKLDVFIKTKIFYMQQSQWIHHAFNWRNRGGMQEVQNAAKLYHSCRNNSTK